MSNGNRRKVLGLAAAAAVLSGLYALAFWQPARSRSHPARDGSGSVPAASADAAEPSPSRAVRAPSAAAAQDGELQASEPESATAEQVAIENARKPIEQRSAETQQIYYKSWLKGLRHAQELQRDSLQRLEQQQQQAGDETERALLEQQIAARRKLIEERTQQIARFESHLPPMTAP